MDLRIFRLLLGLSCLGVLVLSSSEDIADNEVEDSPGIWHH